MLKANVLLLLLHLNVRPLHRDRVTILVSIWVHNAHRNPVNITQLDGGGVDLTCSPLFKTNWFLELAGDFDLRIVHIVTIRHIFTIIVNAELILFEILMQLHLVIVEIRFITITGIVTACKRNESMNPICIPVLISGESVEDLCSTLRVPHKRDLWFSSHFSNLFNKSRDVVLSHVSPREIPVLFAGPPRLSYVIHIEVTIRYAPIVSKPNIVSTLSEMAGEQLIIYPQLQCQPFLACTTGSSLHQDRGLIFIFLTL